MSQSLRGCFPILPMVVFSFQIICSPLGLRSWLLVIGYWLLVINGYLLSGSLPPNSGPQVPLDTVEANTPASEICVWRRKSGKRAVMQAKRVSENKDICVKSCTQGRGVLATGSGGAASGSMREKERLSRPEHRPGGRGKGAAGSQGGGAGATGRSFTQPPRGDRTLRGLLRKKGLGKRAVILE